MDLAKESLWGAESMEEWRVVIFGECVSMCTVEHVIVKVT